jgi:broad specificity phosphatase PhoE
MSPSGRGHDHGPPIGAARPVVHLVRHGETVEYRTDTGLTPLGRRQAVAAGRCLAARIGAGEYVTIVHSPRARTRETAILLRDGLVEAAATRIEHGEAGGVPIVGQPVEEPGFDNFRVCMGDDELEVTAAFGRFVGVRPHGDDTRVPGWVAEADRFWRIHESGGDPIGHWLTQPMQHIEPAVAVVRRMWSTIVRTAADARVSGVDHLVICSHSGPIRAIATQALGADPGEPDHLEELELILDPDGRRATIRFRGTVVDIDVPVTAEPSWFRS